MSFYGLSTLQKINSKSASKWFGTAKIGEYLLILADFLFSDGFYKFQTWLKLYGLCKCYKCCVSDGCKQKRIMVQYLIFFLRGEVLYDSNNRLRRREFTKRKKSS